MMGDGNRLRVGAHNKPEAGNYQRAAEPMGDKEAGRVFVIFQWEKSREERTFTRKIINLDIGVKSSSGLLWAPS